MKKLSTTKQVLNILNTQGGKKPKQLIALTKASSASVYNALHTLRGKKMIAKEDDGVYITQTQKAVSKVTNKNGWKTVLVGVSDVSTQKLQKEIDALERLCGAWAQKYERLEADYTQAKIMYLNSQAVVTYLEEKVAQLIKG